MLTWKSLAKSLGKEHHEVPVIFERVEIHAPIVLQTGGEFTFSISIAELKQKVQVIAYF